MIAYPKLTFAMTDIHGRFDLLQKALAEIEIRYPANERKYVFCGDYVDRGPQSAEVVQAIMDLCETSEVVALRGNHEDMFVEYVLGGEKHHRIARQMFESNGGLKTLVSYERWAGDSASLAMKRHALWMQSLPYWHKDDKRVFLHAGMWPGKPIEQQSTETLAWMRALEFFNATRIGMGYHVVHGHTPVHDMKDRDRVEQTEARTNLDLASFASGKLAVGVFDGTREMPINVFVVEAH